jgi:hypothetical protein
MEHRAHALWQSAGSALMLGRAPRAPAPRGAGSCRPGGALAGSASLPGEMLTCRRHFGSADRVSQAACRPVSGSELVSDLGDIEPNRFVGRDVSREKHGLAGDA